MSAHKIEFFLGATIIYLIYGLYIYKCVFGNYLEMLHEKYSNSFLGYFMLFGKFKSVVFYVRFYKLVAIIGFCFASFAYTLFIIKVLDF